MLVQLAFLQLEIQYCGMNEFFFSIGSTYQEKLYIGATIGIPSIDYYEYSEYTEQEVSDTSNNLRQMRFSEEISAYGEGYNLKIGAIYRISEKIKIGGALQTPTFFNIEEDKIEVIYQGCNKVFQEEQSADFKTSISTKHQLPKKYLLYVGTIEERKNLYNLLRCLKELPDYQLVVIGNGKAYKNKCLDFINENKMNNRIKILSDLSLKEMAAIYQQAEIMIYPSFFEGFGIPILESLFCGVPVITSKGGCFAEPGGKYSSYINPNDIEQMKSEIVDISTNISRREKMIEEGKKHAQNFTDDKIAERLMNLYQNI